MTWGDSLDGARFHSKAEKKPLGLRPLLLDIGWSGRHLAEVTDFNERDVRRWVVGQGTPPDWLEAWLQRLAEFHRSNPPPRRS